MFSRMLASAAGGSLVGLAAGILPPLPEVRNFQIVVLESVYAQAAAWAPKPVLRFLSTLAGEWLTFTLLGGAVGALFGLFLAMPASRRPGSPVRLAPAMIFTAGVFAFLGVFVWCRIVLVHSDTLRLLSRDGVLVALAALGIGIAAASALTGINQALEWISSGGLWLRRVVCTSALGLGMFIPVFSPAPSAALVGEGGLAAAGQAGRVVLLETGGATWDVALPMVREGRLPHVAELMRRGAWGDLRAALPMESSLLWARVSTGKRETEPGAKTAWDIAGEAGRTVDVVHSGQVEQIQNSSWRFHAARKGSPLARWLYPPVPEEEAEQKGSSVEEAYEQMDAALGELLKQAGPETLVMLVSDHGAGIKAPGELNFSLNPVLERMGFAADATRRASSRDRELFLNERPLSPDTGAVSDEKKARVLRELGGRLARLRTASGRRVMSRVRLSRDKDGIFLSARLNTRLKPGETVRGEGWEVPVSEIIWPEGLTGTHRMPGMIVLAGPGVKPGHRIRAASILDVAPTLLYAVGLPVSQDLDGRVLRDVFLPTNKNGQEQQP